MAQCLVLSCECLGLCRVCTYVGYLTSGNSDTQRERPYMQEVFDIVFPSCIFPHGDLFRSGYDTLSLNLISQPHPTFSLPSHGIVIPFSSLLFNLRVLSAPGARALQFQYELGITLNRPPSLTSTFPLRYAPAREHMNSVTPAMSSSSPERVSGISVLGHVPSLLCVSNRPIALRPDSVISFLWRRV